MSSNA